MFKQGESIDNNYRIKKVLGRGGQVIVYLCEDRGTNDGICVIKELMYKCTREEDRAKELNLFRQEGIILKEISHPNLPQVMGTIENEKGHFIIEEYIEGTPIDKFLRKSGGKLREDQVLSVAMQMLSLLECLHTHNPPVIIRDIKPSNMIMNPEGKVFFIDFTIARYMIKDKDDTVRMGSPGYSPPEQYRGLSTPQSDIYALGVTLHQLLTGHDPLSTPFTLPEACRVNPGIDKKWEVIICKATQLRVEDRYTSAVELKTELDTIEKELSSQAGAGQEKITSSIGKAISPNYLKYAIMVIIALFAVGALLFTGFYLTHAKTEYIKLTGCLDNMKSISTAMEAYGNEHNKCPGSMSDLVPAHLPALPVCPTAKKTTYQIEIIEAQTVKDTHIIRTTCKVLCSGGYHKNLPEVKGSPFKIVTVETR